MTKEQAAAKLIEAYPGKMHYVSCHQWSMDGKTVSQPKFAVCVYDVLPGDNATGDGATIGEAVTNAIKNDPATKAAQRDADAMLVGEPMAALAS